MPILIPDELVSILRAARHIVVFTGAGISAESGIPTFRDALTGLWERFDASDLATADAFRRDRALVWGWYEWRRAKVMRAQPNPAHLAIAALEQVVPSFTLITQNVDDLHERAGSSAPIHLHGSLQSPRCSGCARPFEHPPGIPDEPEGGRHIEPPRCAHCGGGRIRPGVVWFGESLPEEAWRQAHKAVMDCDALFSVGTSSLVFPAAELPIEAARKNKVVIQVNPQPTRLDTVARFNLVGPAGSVLPKIYARTWHDVQDQP